MNARAVLLLIQRTSLDDVRQMAACLRYADDHRLVVVGVTADEHGAVDMIVNGEATVLLVAVEPLGGGLPAWIAARVEECGGELVVVRRNPPLARAADNAETSLIRTALANSGGDVELVARLLGLPVERVAAIASVTVRRPRRLHIDELKEVHRP